MAFFSTNLLHLKSGEEYLSKDFEKNLIRNVEAFIEDNKEFKRAYFYRPPRLRQYWEEEQEEIESWKELFYDLIYVAVAFQLGKVLEELIVQNEPAGTIIFFLAQFLPLYGLWFSRTLFLSRFITNSYFHGMLDIMHSLLIALMALFISKKKEIEETIGGVEAAVEDQDETIGFNRALSFSTCALIAVTLNLFRSFELICLASKYEVKEQETLHIQREQRRNVIYQGKLDLGRNLISFACFFLSVIGSISGDVNLFLYPLLLAFFTETLYHIVARVILAKCMESASPTLIPLNIGFVLTRFGEFTMLMLGEGILQIIILGIDAGDLAGHLKTFILAFLSLSCLFTLAFYGLTYEAHESAMRRSAFSGLLITAIYPLIFASIMSFGVAIKLVLKNQAKIDEGVVGTGQLAFANFSTISVGLILIARMINHGSSAIGRKDQNLKGKEYYSWGNVNFIRIFYSIFLVCLAFQFETLRAIDSVEGPVFLGIALVYFVVIFFFGFIEEKCIIKEEHEEEKHNIILSQEVYEKYDGKEHNTLQEHVEGPSKVGQCKISNVLEFMRKKTKLIDAKVNAACENGDMIFAWQRDVEEVEELARLIRETFEGQEKMLEEKRREADERGLDDGEKSRADSLGDEGL